MRVLRILVALVIAPFLASVSQAQAPGSQGLINGHGHDAAHCAMRAGLHPGAVINKCDPPAPIVLPPACASTGALALGTVVISGRVRDNSTFAGLSNWCVEVSGLDDNGVPVSATMPTDGSGNYIFTGLPPGTYSVCEEVQSGWQLTWPSSAAACPGGVYYTFSLANGDVGGFVNFGNTKL